MSSPLEGTWEGGPQGFKGITIFTGMHYCSLLISNDRKRFQADQPTEAEAADAFHAMRAAAGTYAISGSTLTMRYEYDRPPLPRPRQPQTYEFDIEGRTLTVLDPRTGAPWIFKKIS
jgi:hypothetical protein